MNTKKPEIDQDTINFAVLALADKIQESTGVEINDSVYTQLEDEVTAILEQQFENIGYTNYN
jgi:hypothetical protein